MSDVPDTWLHLFVRDKQLTFLFGSLSSDRDHRGISNGQLAVEDQALALKYRNKSIAEQNSVDLAWNLLMEDQFRNLRKCLFTTEAEMKRFRQVRLRVVVQASILLSLTASSLASMPHFFRSL